MLYLRCRHPVQFLTKPLPVKLRDTILRNLRIDDPNVIIMYDKGQPQLV